MKLYMKLIVNLKWYMFAFGVPLILFSECFLFDKNGIIVS